MKARINQGKKQMMRNASSQEILILPDGRILTHNLTPALAAVLRKLNLNDQPMQQRARDIEHGLSHELRERT